MLYKYLRFNIPMTVHQTLIHKYKPYYVKDFTDNENFKNSVQVLQSLDNLNLLFIGNSCSGKTTLLDCIVRDYYNLSQNEIIRETNILYINNLKDQGIQFFRNEMKTFCQSTCSIRNKKKLILIDDLDTINDQSQQVFRNYIDKYSKNVNFICVCNTVQKVIESLQSRLHIIKIPQFTNSYCASLLEKVNIHEGLGLSNNIKQYILNATNNSVRILLNHLEKIYLYKNKISLEDCKELCNSISYQHFDLYYEHIKNKDLVQAVEILNNIYDYGYSVIDIFDYLFQYTKVTTNLEETIKYEIIIILCKYISIFHSIHEDPIELSIFTSNICKLFM